MNQQSTRFQNFVETLKSFATLSREVIIVLVIIFIFFWPANFKTIMEQAGFKKFDFGFGTWERELVASTARLQDANQVMETYQNELLAIKNTVNELTESPNINEATRAKIVKINDRIEKTYEASFSAKENIEDNITQQKQILSDIRQEQSLPPPPSGQWAIVAGADREVDAALYEVNKLKEQGYGVVQLWLRGGWYRTVIIFDSRQIAERNLNKLKRAFRESAFITNLNEWCPNPIEIEENLIFECRGR